MNRSDSIFDTQRTMKFHLELTDKCNAACPMCGRTKEMDRCLPDMTKVRNIELDLDLIKRNFTPDLCSRISEIDLCGGLGDPPGGTGMSGNLRLLRRFWNQSYPLVERGLA